MIVEITNQGSAPCIAAWRIAQRIKLQCYAVIDAQFLQQLICHDKQFDVGSRFSRADDFGIDLVKLPITALLRAFITEQWPMHRQFHRRKLLPAIGQIGTRDASGKFGPKRNGIPAAIIKTVHLLRDNICRLTKAARKHRCGFNHGQLQPFKAIQPAHAFKRCHNMCEAFFGLSEHVLRAAHGLGGLYLYHGQAP